MRLALAAVVLAVALSACSDPLPPSPLPLASDPSEVPPQVTVVGLIERAADDRLLIIPAPDSRVELVGHGDQLSALVGYVAKVTGEMHEGKLHVASCGLNDSPAS